MRHLLILALLPAALSFLVAEPAFASVIEIQFSGVDLTYSGSNLFDAGASNTTGQGIHAQADDLTMMNFLLDGVQVGSMLTSNINMDLYISGLSNIPVGGGFVTTAGNGDGFGIDLLTRNGDPGWGLAMHVDKMNFFYAGSGIAIAVAGQNTSLWTQSLPYQLAFDPTKPISISLSSANLTGVTSASGYVTGFRSSGTGNISGQGTRTPEPATLLLLAMSGLAMLKRRS